MSSTLYGTPFLEYAVRSGVRYTADASGRIDVADMNDRTDLLNAGCLDHAVFTNTLLATAGSGDRAASYLLLEGHPISGGNGTFAGFAAPGVLLVSNEPAVYQNLGSRDVPVWVVVGGSGGLSLIGTIIAADMNSVGDQPFQMLTSPGGSFRVRQITVSSASTSLDTVVGGVYTTANKAGTAIVASNQTYSDLIAPELALDLTIASTPGNTYYPNGTQLYLSLSFPQGATATADFFIYGQN